MEQHAATSKSEQAGFSEKRAAHRQRVLKTGTLLFNKGYASYDCTIRNLNEGGAMVEMGETTGIPQEFEFRMDGKNTIPSSIVWRTRNRIGIRFGN
ncbi:MAG: PilZ domain-containing protein [Rhizobiaceae bacterium]